MSPDLNSVLVTIGGALAGNAVLLAALGFIGKSWFQSAVGKDLERFKTELKREADAELERVKAALNRELEEHKARLKRSDFLFEREFLAASAMLKLYDDVYPKKSHPDMDWDDAMEEVAAHAGATRTKLDLFVIEHGAALAADLRKELGRASSLATELEMDMIGVSPDEVHGTASSLCKCLEGLRDALLDQVRSRTGA